MSDLDEFRSVAEKFAHACSAFGFSSLIVISDEEQVFQSLGGKRDVLMTGITNVCLQDRDTKMTLMAALAVAIGVQNGEIQPEMPDSLLKELRESIKKTGFKHNVKFRGNDE